MRYAIYWRIHAHPQALMCIGIVLASRVYPANDQYLFSNFSSRDSDHSIRPCRRRRRHVCGDNVCSFPSRNRRSFRWREVSHGSYFHFDSIRGISERRIVMCVGEIKMLSSACIIQYTRICVSSVNRSICYYVKETRLRVIGEYKFCRYSIMNNKPIRNKSIL